MVTVPADFTGGTLFVKLKTGHKIGLLVPKGTEPGTVIKAKFPTPPGSGLGRSASAITEASLESKEPESPESPPLQSL